MTVTQQAKTERLDVRASKQVKALLQQAAKANHKNVSEFLLDAGIAAALSPGENEGAASRFASFFWGNRGGNRKKGLTANCDL